MNQAILFLAAALILVLVMVVALSAPVAIAAQSLIVHSAAMVEAVRSWRQPTGFSP